MSQVVEKIKDKMTSENAKIESLKHDTVDTGSSDARQTTDHGVPTGETEQWLRTISKDGLREGPSLLEDQIAREKVFEPHLSALHWEGNLWGFLTL